MSDDALDYLDAVYRDHKGYGFLVTGRYNPDTGKVDLQGSARGVPYRWPEQRAEMAAAAVKAADAGDDVYACPALMHTKLSRESPNAADRSLIHAEIDVPLDAAKLDLLPAVWAVNSGRSGHAHVYVRLAEQVDNDLFGRLSKALAHYFGDTETSGKSSPGDILRVPGGVNSKPDGGPVTWLRRPAGDCADLDQLCDLLNLSANDPPGTSHTPGGAPVGVPDPLPESVSRALGRVNPDDRSASTMAVVGACNRSRLTLNQTRAVVDSSPPLRARLEGRKDDDDDVLRCWLEVDRQAREELQLLDVENIASRGPEGHGPEVVLEPAEVAPALSVVRLADVEPERVTWLWPGRIPAGKLVTLDGDPSLGKSTLALTFAAAITTAGTWPDDTRVDQIADVVLLSAEDGLADTVRPRLDAAGADVHRVHAVQGVTLSDGTLAPPTLADVHELTKLIKKVGARLLVVDVLMAYLPSGTDSHKDQDVRRVLSRLSAMADETGCTVLLLRHLNKSKGGDPMYRGGGSIGIVGAARAGMLVAEDPEDPTVRILASTKSNLGPPPESLRYRLASVDGTGVARVEWLGTDERNARQLLAAPADEEAGALTEAESWLADYLTEHKWTKSADAKRDGVKAGLSQRTVERAAKSLKIVSESRDFPRVTYWSLPSDASTASTSTGTPVSQNLGATGATGLDLHRQFGATGENSQSRQVVSDGATGENLRRIPPPGGAEIKAEPTPPGGVTTNTPGLTDRVEQALATAKQSTARDASPSCVVCSKPVTSGQGDRHLSCKAAS